MGHKNVILFDDDNWKALLPLTYTRPICELRIGILKIKEKWEQYLDCNISHITQDYLSEKFPIHVAEDNYIINSTILPDPELIALIKDLNTNEALVYDDELIVARVDRDEFDILTSEAPQQDVRGIDISEKGYALRQILRPNDIFQMNAEELENDYTLLTAGRTSAPLSSSNQVRNSDRIFLEEGATVKCAILSADNGPIYIGKDAEIMEGSIVRGGLALGEGAKLKLGTKIYGATTIGPHSKVGGEINNSVILGYSNKAHDGFLGNSILGEWCNLGADTNTSNLKNNYTEVKLWNYDSAKFEKTGSQFCGLVMGDHAKCGINTMFNTGTVVGVAANIFGSGYPRNFVPSYAWGGASGFSTYRMEKCFEVAEIIMKRRDLEFREEDRKILQHIFHNSSSFRSWEV